jgi:hypothetical protein
MTRPVNSSFSYYGSQAGQIVDQAASRLQNAFDRIGAAIRSLGNAFRAVSYGLRQEVPFERWFFDHGFEKPIENPCDLLKAHFWAVLATSEGSIRMCAETVAYVFSLVFEPGESPRHLDVLKAQIQGVALSLQAIFFPNAAKAAAHNSGRPIIGCSILNWNWGTLYTGKLDVPLWHVECKQYPWADRPAQ